MKHSASARIYNFFRGVLHVLTCCVQFVLMCTVHISLMPLFAYIPANFWYAEYLLSLPRFEATSASADGNDSDISSNDEARIAEWKLSVPEESAALAALRSRSARPAGQVGILFT